MKILHTSDWHIGKRLGRHDRMQEHAAVLEEVARIADEREVDLILVSGDVFDRPIPPVDALALGLEALQRLAALAPVIAVAGNHDSPELFDALAPFLRAQGKGVHLVGAIRRPGEGAILGPEELDVPAAVACFPFLREGRVVDFMRDTGAWYGEYAERVAGIAAAYNRELVARAGADIVPLFMAHFLVTGAKVDRGAPRGERELHMGEAYAATAQAIPPGPQYVAMGHIHAPQPVPSAPVPAQYAGSLLPLDFGEAGAQKRVVIVEGDPGRLAAVTSIPLTAGRPLRRETGTWEELAVRADELREDYLDLTVQVGGTDADLGRRAAAAFPYLVHVRAQKPTAERREPLAAGEHRSDDALYADYYRRDTGEDAPLELLSLLREALEEAADAPT